MTRILFLCCLSFIGLESSAQVTYKKYYLQLKDKGGSTFSMMLPQDFLSPAALDRRAQARIPIDSTDLPVSPIYLQQVRAESHKILIASKWLNGIAILADSSQIEKLRILPFITAVKYIGPFYGYRFTPDAKPKVRMRFDTIPLAQNGFETVDEGYAARQTQPMSAQLLYDLFDADGAERTVAIMDGGFTNVDASPFFQHLADHNGFVSTRDLVEGDQAVYEASGHGSTVLSVMAGYAPHYFRASATEASYHLLITEDSNGEYPIEEINWVAGAEYADSVGAHIINASLGYTSFNDTTLSHTYRDLDGRTALASKGASIAARKGMIICNSAGNSGEEDWHYIGVPSDAPGIISVGATNSKNQKAGFSSFGPSADGRIKPDLSAPGEMIFGMAPDGLSVHFTSGTSFASPILAAGFAALWSGFPEQTAKEIVDLVMQNASQAQNPDNALGYGVPDFFAAYLMNLNAYNQLSHSVFRIQTVHTRGDMTEALVFGQAAVGATVAALRLTDAAGRVEQYRFDSTDASAQCRTIENVIHFVRWPKWQCAQGLMKCEVIFAEGGNITSYILAQ